MSHRNVQPHVSTNKVALAIEHGRTTAGGTLDTCYGVHGSPSWFSRVSRKTQWKNHRGRLLAFGSNLFWSEDARRQVQLHQVPIRVHIDLVVEPVSSHKPRVLFRGVRHTAVRDPRPISPVPPTLLVVHVVGAVLEHEVRPVPMKN